MELVYLVIVVLGMGLVLAVGKRVCIVVVMRVFGWKPKILDEQQVDITIKECTAEFFQQCKNLRPEQVAPEHHGGDRRSGVLQREVGVPARLYF